MEKTITIPNVPSRRFTWRNLWCALFMCCAFAAGACGDSDDQLVPDPDPVVPGEPETPEEPGTPEKKLREDATPLFFDAAQSSGIALTEIAGEPNGYVLTIDENGRYFIPTTGLKEELANKRVKLVFEYKCPVDIAQFNLGFSNETDLAYCGVIPSDVDRDEEGWAPYSVSLVNDAARFEWGAAGDWLGFFLRPTATGAPVTFEIRDIYLEESDEPVGPIEPEDPNRYPLSFSNERAATDFETKYGRSDGIQFTRDGDAYHVVFVESHYDASLAHNEHMFATDPLTRILSMNDNQKVELVFKYKAVTSHAWQFTTYLQMNTSLDVFNASAVDNQAMKASADAAPDSEGWATYRQDMTDVIKKANWGQDPTASPQIRFRFRLTRTAEITDPAHPERYDFKEIDLKDVYLQVSDKEEEPEPGPEPSGDAIDVTFTADHAMSDFESRFKGVGMLFGYENNEYYHFQLDESSDHVQHVIYSDIIGSALSAADISGKSVQIVFKYKARVNGTASGTGEWYQKWFFKIVPVLDGMSASEYNSTMNALQADGSTTDNLKFGTDAAPMEWTEYRMYLNPSFASQSVISAWGTDLAKHPQLRLDFRARNTTNNDCPVKSIGLTDLYIKDMRIEINDK